MKTSDSYGFKEEYEVRLLSAVQEVLTVEIAAQFAKAAIIITDAETVQLILLFLEVVIEMLLL